MLERRVTGLQLFLNWAVDELKASGYTPLAVTRVMRMQLNDNEMNLEDASGRLVFDAMSPTRWRTHEGVKTMDEAPRTCWVVADLTGFCVGRTRKKGKTSKVEPFTSRDDACTYARFPPSGDGKYRVVQFLTNTMEKT